MSAPDSSYAASVPARHTTGWPSYDAVATAIPPAANRLVANVARAVCAATEPRVARNTGVVAGSSRSASKAAP